MRAARKESICVSHSHNNPLLNVFFIQTFFSREIVQRITLPAMTDMFQRLPRRIIVYRYAKKFSARIKELFCFRKRMKGLFQQGIMEQRRHQGRIYVSAKYPICEIVLIRSALEKASIFNNQSSSKRIYARN